MRTAKVNISFSGYTDANLLTKAELISTSMTGNPAFVTPIPTLGDLDTATKNYSNALVAAAGLGRVNIASKNALRQQLELLLAQLGMYVMYIANGDELILTSSGYTLGKVPESTSIFNPGGVTLSNGVTTGQMVSTVKGQKGVASYLHEYCMEEPIDATLWISNATSRAQFTFNNLLAGRKYWVRVAVIGTNGQIAYSTIASQFVQ